MGATTLRLSGVRAGRRCGRSQRYGITCLKRWQRFHNAPCRMAGRRVRGAQGALIGFSQETIKPGTQIAPRDCAPNFLVAVLVPYHVDQHSGVPLSRSRKVDPAVILWNLSLLFSLSLPSSSLDSASGPQTALECLPGGVQVMRNPWPSSNAASS
jgi:hypothetical protein